MKKWIYLSWCWWSFLFWDVVIYLISVIFNFKRCYKADRAMSKKVLSILKYTYNER